MTREQLLNRAALWFAVTALAASLPVAEAYTQHKMIYLVWVLGAWPAARTAAQFVVDAADAKPPAPPSEDFGQDE